MGKKKKSDEPPALGHRERQLVETVYRLGEAAVGEVLEQLEDPPSYSSVRAMLGSLVNKNVLRFRRDGKRYLYRPAIDKDTARKSALDGVLQTFFGGSPSDAVAALLDDDRANWSESELRRIRRLIDQKRNSKAKGTE